MVHLPNKPVINSYAALKLRVTYLETLKEAQEEELKNDFRNVLASLQPANLVKSALHNITHDDELKSDAGSLGLNLGLDFLVGKLFNKNGSIGSYLKAVVAEQVIAMLMNKYGDRIGELVGTLKDKLVTFFQKKEAH